MNNILSVIWCVLNWCAVLLVLFLANVSTERLNYPNLSCLVLGFLLGLAYWAARTSISKFY